MPISARRGSRRGLSNPAPLGLFSFALTTFVLSCYNAGIFGVSATDPINVAVGVAVFYGGTAQALAGMWEFVYGDTFAATAFTSYGAFWLSYGALQIPWYNITAAYNQALGSDAERVLSHAKATYLLGWTIFTYIMTVASTRTSIALCILFCLVALTLTLLTTAEFGHFTGVHRAGGFLGIITAIVAWYNALSELLDSQHKPVLDLPLGRIAQPTDDSTSKDMSSHNHYDKPRGSAV